MIMRVTTNRRPPGNPGGLRYYGNKQVKLEVVSDGSVVLRAHGRVAP